MSVTSRLALSIGCCALVACSGGTKTESKLRDTSSAGSGDTAGSAAVSPAEPSGGSANSGPSLNIDAGSVDTAGTGGSGDGTHIIATLPLGFQPTDLGGFLLGPSLAVGGAGGSSPGAGGSWGTGGSSDSGGTGGSSDSGGTGGASGGGGAVGSTNGNCGNVLLGVARDFRRENEAGSNPDFESPVFQGNDVSPGLVSSLLGADQKPVYASKCELGVALTRAACPYGAQTSNQTNFDQWYRDTPGINLPFAVSLYLAPQPGGLFTFQSLHYFPLDNAGFGNSGTADDKLMHNFGFTTEIHTQFSYTGGETFQFQGDDDVWVFINGKLTVDLGGLHPRMLGTVSLDASATMLGLQKGNVYSLDLFHAERHTDKSTFRIDTNLSFVNCGTTESAPK